MGQSVALASRSENTERKSVQARALRENQEYILPARFDSTEIPGIRETLGYVTLKGRTPKQLADLIRTKIGKRQRKDFLPPIPTDCIGG
jgi:hypothetical protein